MTESAQTLKTSLANLERYAFTPVSGLGLYTFRIFFGLTLLYSLGRFWAYGWVEQFFVTPQFMFKYWAFEWVPNPTAWAAYGLFALLTGLAFCITLGVFYRLSMTVFFIGFTYLQLADAANYLNHYYLVVLVCFLLIGLPASGGLSLARKKHATVPQWVYSLLRFQVGLVYFYAGMAKFNSDWLLQAQPINIWMSARTDVWLIGPFLAYEPVHYLMAWSGFLFDLSVPFFLLWSRTRMAAYLVVIVFHTMTGMFFAIGLFPLIMVVGASIFFPTDWPKIFLSVLRQRFFKRMEKFQDTVVCTDAKYFGASKSAPWIIVALGLWMTFHVSFPMRHLLYSQPVTWSEEGMRFSWKVMVREKNGSVTFRVKQPDTGREWQVPPRRYLSMDQEREMSGQPELILQLAHHIAKDFESRGLGRVEVRADAYVSWNSRPLSRFIDPDVDLTKIEDNFRKKNWILPAPKEAPNLIGRR